MGGTESGIAGGADVILVPEIPYDINKVAKAILNEGMPERASVSLLLLKEPGQWEVKRCKP